MTENSAVLKIIAKHTKEYNELSVKYTDLGSKLRDFTNRFVNLKILNAQLTNEIRGYKKLLEKQQEEIVEDLNSLEMTTVIWDDETHLHIEKGFEMNKVSSGMVFMPDITKLKMKWEALKG